MAGLPGTASQCLQPNAYRATNSISQELEKFCSQKEYTLHPLLEHYTKNEPEVSGKEKATSFLLQSRKLEVSLSQLPAQLNGGVCSEMC